MAGREEQARLTAMDDLTMPDWLPEFDENGFETSLQPWLERTAAFEPLIDRQHGPIGRVVASEREPSGSHQFFFWAGEDQRTLDVGHIIVAFSEDAAVIGVVDEPRRYSDMRSFLDDFFDRHMENALESEPPTARPEILVFQVNVLRTKHIRPDVDSRRPVIAGPVFFATNEAIDFALGRDGFGGVPIPALLHVNGNAQRDEHGQPRRDANGNEIFQRSAIWLDEDYLLGPEAGHANWTGQSGLATKTSHALFLTSAVFQQLEKEDKSVAALMFNVKGPDLIWLDKPATPDDDLESAFARANVSGLPDLDIEAYAALGLEIKPFDNFRLFAPFKPGQAPTGTWNDPVVSMANGDYRSNLNTLRDNPAHRTTVFPILWGLRTLLANPYQLFDFNDLDDKLWALIAELRDQIGVKSLIELQKTLTEALTELTETGGSEWRNHHKFTIQKALNRFGGLPTKFAGLLTDGEVDYGRLPKVDEPFSNQEVRVVDIAGCSSNVQELIVSNVIQRVWRLAENQELGVSKLIVFVDELNKHAPAGGQGGLRDTLVDIAARGRHLNVVLFGAQQFRSKVDGEILGNCGTSLYGRVGDEEIINSSYRSLSETTKAELLGLPKGRLLVRHAHFRAPLFGLFPRPPVIPGMDGQRVFNNTTAGEANAFGHPGDPVYFLLRELGDTSGVSKGIVRTETEGLTPEEIEQICNKVRLSWRSKVGTSAARRISPWSMCQNAIRTVKMTSTRI